MSEPLPTIAACLTPAGRGAIATIGVRGPAALAAVEQHFAPHQPRPLRDYPVNRIVFGRWTSRWGEEELVVCRTAEDTVEIHCHGGTAATSAILAALASHGCLEVSADEWIECSQPPSAARQALLALPDARTERTAAILLDQARGALDRAVANVRDELRAGRLEAARSNLARLAQLSRLGRHLTTPFRVAIVGRPNVGKSSLINALLGYERSIVFDQPGTTRDVVTATTAFDGWPVELRDTAGLRAAGDAIEAEGIARAEAEMRQAEAVVWVRDATSPDHDPSPAEEARVIIAWNKCDLAAAPAGALSISARTGAGLDRLQQEVLARLCPHSPAPGEGVPFTMPQQDAIDAALTHLAAERIDAALSALSGPFAASADD